ncbi:MAG: MarR family transcriptional regulator [Acidobacteriota bacterium]|nr:MarR family transcriptional regulator [Acidobacteriota bacterium]
MPPRQKDALIDQLIQEFRASASQDDAFDTVAAARLGVSDTDMRCLNIIENRRGIMAGELASASGLTAGAVTGVVDRLEARGYARRLPDASDRRRVRIEVTQAFYRAAERIWGPLAADWQTMLSESFTSRELELIISFLRSAAELAQRHLDRVRSGEADR